MTSSCASLIFSKIDKPQNNESNNEITDKLKTIIDRLEFQSLYQLFCSEKYKLITNGLKANHTLPNRYNGKITVINKINK